MTIMCWSKAPQQPPSIDNLNACSTVIRNKEKGQEPLTLYNFFAITVFPEVE